MWPQSMGTSQRSQSLQILGHSGKHKKGERCRHVHGPGAPATHTVPVGPLADHPGLTAGPCLQHMVRTCLTSAKYIVTMSFLPAPPPDPAVPESLFQSIISFNKVLEPIKNSLFNILPPPPCHLECSVMSKTSPLPILKLRIKGEKRRENFIERRDQKLPGHHYTQG